MLDNLLNQVYVLVVNTQCGDFKRTVMGGGVVVACTFE